MEFDFGKDPDPDPALQAAQLKYALSNNYVSSSNRPSTLKTLTKILVDNELYNYAIFCKSSIADLPLDDSTLSKIKTSIETKLSALEKELKDAQDNLGDVEIMETEKKLALHYYLSETKEKAVSQFNKVKGLKGMSTGQLIDNALKKILLGLLWKDLDLMDESLAEADKFMEIGGDWERRNRLTVYRGFYYMLNRNFELASKNFLSTIATFTCTEVCAYSEFIFYAIVTSIIALDRVEFKKQVIDSSQVKAVYKEIDCLPEFVHSLHDTNYGDFFSALLGLHDKVNRDRYLHDHCKWWVRELRVKSYAQFLESFKSVTLEMMSYEFGVSEKFLDKELSGFIASQRIQAKIDKANGVVDALKPLNRNVHYQEVIKQGDLLLNKVQLLSRLLGV